MFPSPSDGPPWLSLSSSPAPGPCGIPLELEAAEDDPEEGEFVVVAAPEPDEADECVVGAELEGDELEALDPQAATPRATRTSSTALRRRVDLLIVVFIFAPSVGRRENPGSGLDARSAPRVPACAR